MEWPYKIYGYLHDTNLPHITIMIGSSMKQRERKVLFVSSQMTTDRWTTLVQMKRKSVLSPSASAMMDRQHFAEKAIRSFMDEVYKYMVLQ